MDHSCRSVRETTTTDLHHSLGGLSPRTNQDVSNRPLSEEPNHRWDKSMTILNSARCLRTPRKQRRTPQRIRITSATRARGFARGLVIRGGIAYAPPCSARLWATTRCSPSARSSTTPPITRRARRRKDALAASGILCDSDAIDVLVSEGPASSAKYRP
jgi:hypothetical protein